MRGIRKFDAGRFAVVVQFGKEASQNARLLRRKERDASRGSPRSFAAHRMLVQDDKLRHAPFTLKQPQADGQC
jgi:hypothetical protein